MRIDVLTLFPGMFDGPMTESMIWKARGRNLLDDYEPGYRAEVLCTPQ